MSRSDTSKLTARAVPAALFAAIAVLSSSCSAQTLQDNPTATTIGFLVFVGGVLLTILFVVVTLVVLGVKRFGPRVWNEFVDGPPAPLPSEYAQQQTPTQPLRPGDVVWTLVEFESGVDDEGRSAKDRPVLVRSVTSSTVFANPMTSKVDKYRDRPGFVVVSGDWDGPGSTSCVNMNRTVTFARRDIRRYGGQLRNPADVPGLLRR